MCDYIEKQSTQYQPLPLSVENNVQSQILNRPGGGGAGGGRGSEKVNALVGLKEFLPQIFTWGAYCISCQKRL